MRVLVTGGAGYIGSHTVVALAERGHDVWIYDSLVNSSMAAVARIQELAPTAKFLKGDVRDRKALEESLKGMDAVVHFAALKSVAESCKFPLAYFESNLSGTISLLQAMENAGVEKLIFSSSATVYGIAERMPVSESAPLGALNPYGQSKLLAENVIANTAKFGHRLSAILLRYFNPVGAHGSGRIGEHPSGLPNNLMPYISQVAIGLREKLYIFGGDYPTDDGTGVRDYIHVMDLADAHVRALDIATAKGNTMPLNLGTGRGYSVLEVVRAFERVTGVQIPYEIVGRRDGDSAAVWADPKLARRELGWKARYGLDQMCIDEWRWRSANPNGFL